MRDLHTESIVHPRGLLSLDGVSRVLCVAPHPDDEVLGCGGLLAALVERGCVIHTLILTCGDQGAPTDVVAGAADLAARRRAESSRAAAELGTPAPEFLHFADRTLRYGPALVDALVQAIAYHAPQWVLLPSLSEPHPDHQAAALAGLAAARDATGPAAPQMVLFYESGAPLQPNVHLPIDAVAARKWRAVACFTSQLGVEDYEPHARAMAAMRAFGLRPPCREAESFFRVDLDAVHRRGPLAALPQWPWVRASLGLANDPSRIPLVSVLVRSMGRPCLDEALACVALQSHANLELVVVNAGGRRHPPLDHLPPGLRWRLVDLPAAQSACLPVDDAPSGRARAANAALQEAQGDLALFLDDDDLIEPDHLARLVAALEANPQAAGAYAGVRVEAADGVPLRDYDLPWSRERLEGVNYVPIHAVLFRMDRVRERALRFDESLPVLEDWDFWLQLTRDAALVHCPGVSAVYRQALGQSALGDPQHPHHWRRWHRRILERRGLAEPLAATRALAWHAIELDRLQLDADARLARHAGEVSRLQAARDALRSELQAFGEQAREAADAKEAELQRVAEEGRCLLQAKEAELQAFGEQAREAADAKEAELQRVAEEGRCLLQAKEAELQAFGEQAREAADAKEAELQRVAEEGRCLLQAKEAELQAFGEQAREAADAKEAELQRVAEEGRCLLQAKEAELQALRSRVEVLEAKRQVSEAQWRAVLGSRSWRWTAPLRRMAGPGGGSDPA